MKKLERELRKDIVTQCRVMNSSGINQGTSGNISVRFEDRMLISPSAIPYDQMTPESIASIKLDDPTGAWDGPFRPSTEWRFHQKLLCEHDEAKAVVHAHPTYCTTLAIARKSIPACHYMIAAFGGNDVRCSDYATYGTEELSQHVLKAMEGRQACLLANHGMITIGEDLAKAMWRAIELETIARQYYHSLLIGGPILLNNDQINETIEGFASYGLKGDADKTAPNKASRSRVKKVA